VTGTIKTKPLLIITVNSLDVSKELKIYLLNMPTHLFLKITCTIWIGNCAKCINFGWMFLKNNAQREARPWKENEDQL
jgi:hypothetical protein